MEDELRFGARAPACVEVTDVTLVHDEPLPVAFAGPRAHILQVGALAGREVVEPRHGLPVREQLQHETGSYEPRRARHQPAAGLAPQALEGRFVRRRAQAFQTLLAGASIPVMALRVSTMRRGHSASRVLSMAV